MSSRPDFEIKQCTGTESKVWQDAWDIRVQVFHEEQGFSLEDEADSYDPISSSLILSIVSPDGTRIPAGSIRYTPGIGKVSRLAVLKEYRQYGFGRELMLEVEKYLSGSGRLKLHSQIQAIGFYERLGYRAEGERFDEDGAPHQLMVKTI